MEDDVPFGALLRSHRQAASLTIEELSYASGVSVRAIGDMERGVSRGPQKRTVEALADVLRLAPEDHGVLVAAARSGRPRAAAPAAGTCELPRSTGDFTGREVEIRRARATALASADGTSAVTMVFWGTGGMGKTALAVRCAEGMADLFPDGVFFLDLRGMDATPVTTSAGLTRLLRAAGVPAWRIPTDEQELSGEWRAVLRGRRCLVVLDNAADEAQVRPLLPGVGRTVVVITSRRPLAGLEGATRVRLGPLAPTESAALLSTIMGPSRAAAEPEALDDIARLCGRLPLALRIAGNRLQSRPDWSVRHLADRLDSEERRLDALTAGDLRVAAAFALSYEQLTPPAQATFRRLALAAAPEVGVPLVAVLTGRDPDDAEDALEELVDLGLLNSPYPGRYVLHDLVRLYSRARLEREETVDERQEARQRMEDWLLATVVAAAGFFLPDDDGSSAGAPSPVAFEEQPQAADWLHAQAIAWLDALRARAAAGDHQKVLEVADAVSWYSERWRQWGHWPEVYELGEHCARALGDPLQEARQLCYRSMMLVQSEGRYAEAEEAGLRAFELAREAGDLREQGRALQHAGRAASGDPAGTDRQLDHCRRAADLSWAARDWDNYPAAVHALVQSLRRAGRLEEALERGHALLAQMEDPAFKDLSTSYTRYYRGGAEAHLGTTNLALGRWDDALGAYDRALAEHRAFAATDVIFREAVGLTQRRRSTALRQLGRLDEAREALTEADRLYTECGLPDLAAEVRKELEELTRPEVSDGSGL